MKIVLLHGLWLGGWSMRRFATHLQRGGHWCECYSYPTTQSSVAANGRALAEKLATLDTPFGVVGHSLGGITALHALHHLPRPGRLVLLGSPINGSHVARRAARLPGLSSMLGHAADVLTEPVAAPPAGWEIGMIAGNVRLGLGALLGGFARPGDGTVAIAETQATFLADHVVISESHTSLQFSARAAQWTLRFLETGRFQ